MLNAMTKGLAREFKDKGIRVLALLPPPLHLIPNAEQIKESVAHMTVFLSTSYGAFTDGAAIMLDGVRVLANDQKTVLIVGGAQGIGKEIAERFLKEGHRVAVSDIDEQGLSLLKTAL